MNTSCEPIAAATHSVDAAYRPVTCSDQPFFDHELYLTRALMVEQLQSTQPGPARWAGDYQIATGGSMLRARLALASGQAFGCSRRFRIAAAAACELIHNASLVHDDLIDRDEERRSSPTVWKEFGDGVALCTGDLLLCSAFEVASGLDPVEARLLTKLLARTTSKAIAGQSIECGAQVNACTPGLREYLAATTSKTAPLIEMPLMSGALAGGAGEPVKKCIKALAHVIGLAYQIIDDLDDLACDTTVIHAFHAWHYHRPGSGDDPSLRIKRATWHASAALKRARQLLSQFEPDIHQMLGHLIAPLLNKLESRAAVHRLLADRNGTQLNGRTAAF